LAGHVGLHGCADVDAVPVAQVQHGAEEFVQFVGGAGLRMEVERHRREFDAAFAHPVEKAVDLAARAVGLPVLEGVEALNGPPEPSGFRPVVGVVAQLEQRVEVGAMLGHHPPLRVGVADVEVGVLHQVERPMTLRARLEVEPGAFFQVGQLDQQGCRCVYLRHQDAGVGAGTGEDFAGDRGAPARGDPGPRDARQGVVRARAAAAQTQSDGLEQSTLPVAAQQGLARQLHLQVADAGAGGDHAVTQDVARDVGVPPGRPGQWCLGHGALVSFLG
jgi:hypothetical protein